MRRRRIWVLSALAAVVQVTVVAGILLLVVFSFQGRPGGPSEPVQRPSRIGLPDDSAAQVASALVAFPSDPVRNAAVSMKDIAQSHTAEVAPAGTRIEPNQATWEQTGPRDGTMTIKVTYPGATSKLYLAFITLEEGKWKLVYTMEADAWQG